MAAAGLVVSDAEVALAVQLLWGSDDVGMRPELLTVSQIDQIFSFLHSKHKLDGWLDRDGNPIVKFNKQCRTTDGINSEIFIVSVGFRFFVGPHAGRVVEKEGEGGTKDAARKAACASILREIGRLRDMQPESSYEVCGQQLELYVKPYLHNADTYSSPASLLALVRGASSLPLMTETDALDVKDWFPPRSPSVPGYKGVKGWESELVDYVVSMLNNKHGRGALVLGVKDQTFELTHCDADLEFIRNSTGDKFANCNPPLIEGRDFGLYELTAPQSSRRTVLLTASRPANVGFLYKTYNNQVWYRRGPAKKSLSGKLVAKCEGARCEHYEEGWRTLWASDFF